MHDSEGERPRRGNTPCHETEDVDMRDEGVPRRNISAGARGIISRLAGDCNHFFLLLSTCREKRKYYTTATLTYQGKKWVGGANGEWHNQEYELLSFRYLESGFPELPNSERRARSKVGWGAKLNQPAKQ
jgi:hypothetical protein